MVRSAATPRVSNHRGRKTKPNKNVPVMSRDVFLFAFACSSFSFISRIEIIARPGRCSGHVVGARAMRPAAAPRIALTATTAALKALAAIDLRLWSGDEGWQAIDATGVRDHRLRLRWLRLVLRLRAMLAIAMMFARLLIALIGLALALIVVAHEGLRLLRNEARLL